MNKAKVFLSSVQFKNEFVVERQLLPILFKKEPLCSIFELWLIEEQAADVPVDTQYLKNIRQSQAVILLLDSEIREAVKKEIDETRRNKIPGSDPQSMLRHHI
jgi:CRISPR/Cas system-associated exonuclease Cas4 (RecB family)